MNAQAVVVGVLTLFISLVGAGEVWVGPANCLDSQTVSTAGQPFCSLSTAFYSYLNTSSPPHNVTFLFLPGSYQSLGAVSCVGCIVGNATLTLASANASSLARISGMTFSLTQAVNTSYSLFIRDLVFTNDLTLSASGLDYFAAERTSFLNISYSEASYPLTVSGQEANFSQCSFADNRNVSGVMSLNVANASLEDSSCDNNQGVAAGCIYTTGYATVVRRCTFTNNTALSGAYCGGAIFFNTGVQLLVEDCTFQGNTAPQGSCGGAVNAALITAKRSGFGRVVSRGNTFTQNNGSSSGSDAMWVFNYDLDSSGDVFLDNGLSSTSSTVSVGGSVYQLLLSLQNVSFTGGAGYALELAYVYGSISNTSFIRNSGVALYSYQGNITLSDSTFIANGVSVEVYLGILSVYNTPMVGNRVAGISCLYDGSISLTNSSVYRNGFTNVSSVESFNDLQCQQCATATFNNGASLCNASWTQQYTPCTVGLDQCGVCGGNNTCVDCSGLAYGQATPTLCQSLRAMGSPAVQGYKLQLAFLDDDHPNALIYPIVNGVADNSTTLLIDNYTLTIVARNASSIDTVVFQQALDTIDFKRSSTTLSTLEGDEIECVVFDGVADNGGFITLTNCLIQASVSISVAGVNVALPSFSLKLDLQLSHWKDLGITVGSDRVVRLSANLQLAEGATILPDTNNPGFEGQVLMCDTYHCPVDVLDFFVADSVLSTAFNWLLAPTSPVVSGRSLTHRLDLEFTGAFDELDYDPNIGLLLGGSNGGGSGDDHLLVEVLVPVLVGGALLLVAAVIVTALAWRWWVWKQIPRGSGQVAFRGEDL